MEDMTPWQAWHWAQFLKALDAAGYAIVRKPELLDRGIPKR